MASAIDRVFERRLAALVNSRESRLLRGALRGLEKESLRVGPDGRISHAPHPAALGSALTHPAITTDYSEALLELVTPTFTSQTLLLDYLADLHRFVYARMDGEVLWANSMPCELAGEADVPIARYGTSHRGRFKHIYRRGLLTRYGGMMQAIAGIHFNYSLPRAFWPLWAELLAAPRSDAEFVSARYFDLIRNFRRHGWVLTYLFGASPALCRSFVAPQGGAGLARWRERTAIGEQATSLRMSDIGYRNRNQAGVSVSANGLEPYLTDLVRAVRTPHPPFAALGVRDGDEWHQLNANLLQIENEYYSVIRPKRAPMAGEQTAHALARAGVEYVEVRVLDLDVNEVSGIGPVELDFAEALLVTLLAMDSPPIEPAEQEALDHNHLLVARSGREPGLRLMRDGRAVPLVAWLAEILEAMTGVSEVLDRAEGSEAHGRALAEQRLKLERPERLPSARLLAELREFEQEFPDRMLELSRRHREAALAAPPRDPATAERLAAEATESLEAQREAEAATSGSFESWLAALFRSQFAQ